MWTSNGCATNVYSRCTTNGKGKKHEKCINYCVLHVHHTPHITSPSPLHITSHAPCTKHIACSHTTYHTPLPSHNTSHATYHTPLPLQHITRPFLSHNTPSSHTTSHTTYHMPLTPHITHLSPHTPHITCPSPHTQNHTPSLPSPHMQHITHPLLSHATYHMPLPLTHHLLHAIFPHTPHITCSYMPLPLMPLRKGDQIEYFQ